MNARSWIFWLSATGLTVFVLAVTGQGVVGPEFDPALQRISEYEAAEQGVLITGLLAWSVSLAALGLLNLEVAARRGARYLPCVLQSGLLMGAAVGVLAAASFSTDRGADQPGIVTQTTTEGQIHDAASAISTACLLAAISLGVVRSHGWIRILTLAVVVVAIASWAALIAIGDPLPGARQRLLVGAACTWQAAWLGQLRVRTSST